MLVYLDMKYACSAFFEFVKMGYLFCSIGNAPKKAEL